MGQQHAPRALHHHPPPHRVAQVIFLRLLSGSRVALKPLAGA